MAIVGGALVPLIFAQVADASGSRFTAFFVPMICYGIIGLFGWRAARSPVTQSDLAEVSPH